MYDNVINCIGLLQAMGGSTIMLHKLANIQCNRTFPAEGKNGLRKYSRVDLIRLHVNGNGISIYFFGVLGCTLLVFRKYLLEMDYADCKYKRKMVPQNE